MALQIASFCSNPRSIDQVYFFGDSIRLQQRSKHFRPWMIYFKWLRSSCWLTFMQPGKKLCTLALVKMKLYLS
ncbi:hypothetical protein HanRHA438_Chr14g0662611 [Helianthus annuus]|uniref:Uncharacterized protein n=1 Tax=Helianthus annuus TaxID=4232 RepID=A0A251SNG5_HELAN|nr:hypothetical protein HanXRQr2_Chr14g0651991 [Helianthus annuus]KAJ0464719.1 hypothetical protein HanHA300_Chr14g0530481 [Helianthus annuus]KAJ0469378.1 hypothetical protein HanIR_Chr14g0707251 [Helianthus annuus]KAJ0486317.1 hypothetical protein HanHA89_Chr14g0578361 [Helianthus annuus]KAJ0656869.1 hypothetical protein HanLR1_Chr14g0540781 [Helianthus annuus]